MTDCFALLNEPRLPWLDSEELKAKFLTLSAQVHPDRVHNASEEEKSEANRRYAELNAAYNCLRQPKERLLHLLEIERGARPQDVQRIPPGTMDLFVQIGQLCREVDNFLAERNKAVSPLVKVQLFQQAMEWTDKLNALQRVVNATREELCGELREMNSRFEAAPPVGTAERVSALPLERVEQIYRVLSYVARWTEQIQERIVQLSF